MPLNNSKTHSLPLILSLVQSQLGKELRISSEVVLMVLDAVLEMEASALLELLLEVESLNFRL